MIVRLDLKDLYHCRVLGTDTVKICEMQNFSPRLENDKQSRTEANIYGFQAEWAVARLFDLDVTGLIISSDLGIDLWWNDISIDVKFTNRPDGDLIFDSMDKFKAAIAILVTKTDSFDEMNVIGWIGYTQFEELSEIKNYGYGDRLRVTQDKLHPVESLWKLMKECEFNKKKKS